MTPDAILATPGVAYAAPPAELLPAITGQISAALASLRPGSTGALVAIVTETGANAAIVAKLPHGWETIAYIGKRWGGPIEGGAAIRREW